LNAEYHEEVMQRAVGRRVSARALAAMVAANLGQDSLAGLLRPELHFDNSLIARSLAYVEGERRTAALASGARAGWAAFGRLAHTCQDFYSHSNYVALWLEAWSGSEPAPIEAIDGLNPAILTHPRLFTGRVYMPVEALWLFPALRPLVKRLVPRDSHAWMNLDSPEAGPMFQYSIEAAVQRTEAEFDSTLAAIGKANGIPAQTAFCDINT
jgi:hypothetical protein